MTLVTHILTLVPAVALIGFVALRRAASRREEALFADRVTRLSRMPAPTQRPDVAPDVGGPKRFALRPKVAAAIALALTTLGAPCAVVLAKDPFVKLETLSASSVILGVAAFAVLRTAGIKPARRRSGGL
jgi:hypothetical protein